MYVVGVTGPDADRASDRLATALGDRGRVATVRSSGGDRPNGDGGPATRMAVDESGWTARGGGSRSLDDALATLAPDHDYAVVVGFPDADVPQVAVGRPPDADGASELLAETADADALDLPAVVDAVEATEPFETLESLVARVKRSSQADRAGAIATFTGRVRARDDADDEPTEYLEFEKYDAVAGEQMDAIRSDLEAREGVFEVLLHHRTGVVEAGEDIVFVVVLAGHREEAFRTVEDGINRLKDEVPLFKKEVTVDEQFWVHQRS